MNTSYFAKYKGDNGVNIAVGKPKWFTGKSYPSLFPPWSLVSKYKQDSDEEYYTKEYIKQVLSKLDPQKVYDDLKDSVILCWEKSGEFCHRRLVALWLERSLGVTILEL